MALSIPLTLVPAQGGTTEPFPDRDLLQVMTFGVIIFSLLVQGLTMKPLLVRLGLVGQTEWQEEYEVISASKGMAAAAITEIERMERTGGLSPKTAKALKKHYSGRVDDMNEQLAALQLKDEDLRREQLRAIKRRLLQIEKSVVRQRHLDGLISEEPMRRMLAELDEELQALDEPVPEGSETLAAVGLDRQDVVSEDAARRAAGESTAS
jgi:CPA1 family monovalent cation:H+ antiporter